MAQIRNYVSALGQTLTVALGVLVGQTPFPQCRTPGTIPSSWGRLTDIKSEIDLVLTIDIEMLEP